MINTKDFINKKINHGALGVMMHPEGGGVHAGVAVLPEGTRFTGGIEVSVDPDNGEIWAWVSFVSKVENPIRNFRFLVVEENNIFHLPYNYNLLGGVILPSSSREGGGEAYHVYVEKEL
jgi:hypothetical protein